MQREAGVSHSFLYTHPTLRERIEHLRQQHQTAASPASDSASENNNIVLALTSEITRLKVTPTRHCGMPSLRRTARTSNSDASWLAAAAQSPPPAAW
ncbi:hypothetical protein [Streptomyces sp. NBC_01483]|uniref:hypothetical protein n=1 Tax=Streptomyces sp. NBC_01483 TaxID=2903883 RepID=UPI002E373B7E|nr:hypothetical protein [Streptomyces sp. NBC_01483]